MLDYLIRLMLLYTTNTWSSWHKLPQLLDHGTTHYNQPIDAGLSQHPVAAVHHHHLVILAQLPQLLDHDKPHYIHPLDAALSHHPVAAVHHHHLVILAVTPTWHTSLHPLQLFIHSFIYINDSHGKLPGSQQILFWRPSNQPTDRPTSLGLDASSRSIKTNLAKYGKKAPRGTSHLTFPGAFLK